MNLPGTIRLLLSAVLLFLFLISTVQAQGRSSLNLISPDDLTICEKLQRAEVACYEGFGYLFYFLYIEDLELEAKVDSSRRHEWHEFVSDSSFLSDIHRWKVLVNCQYEVDTFTICEKIELLQKKDFGIWETSWLGQLASRSNIKASCDIGFAGFMYKDEETYQEDLRRWKAYFKCE